MIHPTAIIDPTAKLHPSVEVGPYSIIGAKVDIDENSWVGPHAVINGETQIGKENKIFQFASIGEIPQDKKFDNESTRLVIGDRNVIRECVTIHKGTLQDQGETVIGDDNLFMANVHIAHDCRVGNGNIFANCASIAGHVLIQDYVIVSGLCGVHQFCHIGSHAFVAHASMVSKDVPPFVMVTGGADVKTCGLNVEGLKRRGFSSEVIAELRQAYKVIYRQGLRLVDAISKLKEMEVHVPEVSRLREFLEQSQRGIVR